jgi:hypothetical protein
MLMLNILPNDTPVICLDKKPDCVMGVTNQNPIHFFEHG